MIKRLIKSFSFAAVVILFQVLSVNVFAADEGQSQQSPANQQALINELLQKANQQSSSSTATTTPPTQPAQQPSTQTQEEVLNNADLNDQAFASTVRNMMPLSSDQIKTLHTMFDQRQEATASYPGTPPKPTASSVLVNLSPGATPPVIRLRSGFITSLVFVDSTGAPWPIQAYDLGDPNSFNIQWDKKSNTLLVQSLTQYRTGNLAVLLSGLNTPVMISLMPGQTAVDYRVDLRIPGIGPNANPVVDGLPESASPQLLSFLDGIPLQGSKTLNIQGDGCEGWLYGGRIYLRTRFTLISPAWISTMSSADGTHVYALQKTPIILVSERGKLMKLAIEGL